MQRSTRYYLAALGLTIASVACAILGDRVLMREADVWKVTVAEDLKKVHDGASTVGD